MKLNSALYRVLSLLLFYVLLQNEATAQTTQPGVEVRIWNLGATNFLSIPEIDKAELPNSVNVVPAVNLADYLKNFSLGNVPTFYAEISGYIITPETKEFKFRLRARDGATLSINDKELINLRIKQEVSEGDAKLNLPAGKHKFLIKFLRNQPDGYKEVTLWWNHKPKTGEFEYIPAEFFQHTPGNKTTAPGTKKASANGIVFKPGHEVPLEDLHPSLSLKKLHTSKFKPMVGGIDQFPNGDLVVSTWDSLGQIFLLKNASSGDTSKIEYKRIAWGLAEPLGVKIVDNEIYILQKQELTKLIDLNGDGVTDRYETICNGWQVSSNFHEFSFGLEYKDGFFYAALAIAINPGGKSTIPQIQDRGKVVKISKDGKFSFIASGLRTPNGIGTGTDNELFIADNQGDWLPSCKLVHVQEGAFYGNNSVDLYSIGKKEVTFPVVWFPQNEIGNSTSQPVKIHEGIYANQMLVGDVTYGGLQRVFAEKVNGKYQGCVFKFSQGFTGGTNRIIKGKDDAYYIGEIGNPGNWGQYGKEWYGLEQVKFNGKTVFEPLTVKAKKNGFEIEFTKPLSAKSGISKEDYTISRWYYEPTFSYGGPKKDEDEVVPTSINLSADRKKSYIELPEMKEGYVYYIRLDYKKVKSADNEELWISEAYYTHNFTSPDTLPIKKVVKPAIAKPLKSIVKPATVAKPVVNAKELEAAELAVALKEGPALLEKRGCRACHAFDKKVLGPGYYEVAAKYKNDPKAYDYLIKKVTNGGGGVWGEYAMASQTHVPKADIKKMVRYILALK